MLRRRLISLVFALPLLAGLCIAAYKLGPSPSRVNNEVVAEAKPVTGPAPSASNNQVFELFGMYQTAVAKGTAAVSPTEYLNLLEARYRQRGYRRIDDFDPNRKVTRRRTSRRDPRGPVKFFQRDDGNGIANISATGEDADLDSNEAADEPYTFSTLVASAAGGGTDWATYRVGVDRNKLAQLDQLDSEEFPGTDPADIPRPPGLKRVYALSSGSASVAIYKSTEKSDVPLITLYLNEMQRHGWTLDSAATSAANSIASGVMCFNKGARSCLIWISPGKEPNTTTVTISAH
jgi:hypothetical protein